MKNQEEVKSMQIVVVTGLSGSGKSTALRALEDIGFFCVDNLPVVLLPKFISIQSDPAKGISKVALVMDLREKTFLDKYQRIFNSIRQKGYQLEILFLDADDDTIVHRFSETRRVHPLSLKGSVLHGIHLEREKLTPLKQMAHHIIDTTSTNVHQLKDTVQRYFLPSTPSQRMVVHIISFGYRFGLPSDADMVFDVRFLPNPYFEEDLKDLNGHHKKVKSYVLGSVVGQTFVQKLFEMLSFLIPLYEREGKSRLNIAMGCTGGRHRSVVMANETAAYFSERDFQVSVLHRDINKS
ncbi:MAG: RNase adapter RapZ [Syntrophales bacterium]|jgi:UPF0042 nucleotide-binding protein